MLHSGLWPQHSERGHAVSAKQDQPWLTLTYITCIQVTTEAQRVLDWSYGQLWAACRRWELNVGLLEEQPVLLTDTPSLQPCLIVLSIGDMETDFSFLKTFLDFFKNYSYIWEKLFWGWRDGSSVKHSDPYLALCGRRTAWATRDLRIILIKMKAWPFSQDLPMS